MMKHYRREDGTVCKAVKFEGHDVGGGKHVQEIVDVLSQADLVPYWMSEETLDEWQENEAGDDYEQVVIPEHIKLAAGNDELPLGGYVVEREGDIYIMAGELFEAIWSLVEGEQLSIERALVAIADICENCGRSIANFDKDGDIYKTFKHTEGKQRYLTRCWPEDTGQPYGLDATPRSYNK